MLSPSPQRRALVTPATAAAMAAGLSSGGFISATRGPVTAPVPAPRKPEVSKAYRGRWTPDEDRALRYAVDLHDGKNWKSIAAHLESRTDVQCLHRWQKVLRPGLIKGPWTKDEDAAVKRLVAEFGCKRWSLIASHLEGRLGKQCRERWYNHLNPTIRKGPWNEAEDVRIIRLHAQLGNKWAEISRTLTGRTDNSIKNRWNSTLKRLLNQALASTAPEGTEPGQASTATGPCLDRALAYLQSNKMLGEGSRRRRASGRPRKKKAAKAKVRAKPAAAPVTTAVGGRRISPSDDCVPGSLPSSESAHLSAMVLAAEAGPLFGPGGSHDVASRATGMFSASPSPSRASRTNGSGPFAAHHNLGESPLAPARIRPRITSNTAGLGFASPPAPSHPRFRPTPAGAVGVATPGVGVPLSSPFTPSALFNPSFTPSQLALTPVPLQKQTPVLGAGITLAGALAPSSPAADIMSPPAVVGSSSKTTSSGNSATMSAQDLSVFGVAGATPRLYRKGSDGPKPDLAGGVDGDGGRVARHLSFAEQQAAAQLSPHKATPATNAASYDADLAPAPQITPFCPFKSPKLHHLLGGMSPAARIRASPGFTSPSIMRRQARRQRRVRSIAGAACFTAGTAPSTAASRQGAGAGAPCGQPTSTGSDSASRPRKRARLTV